MGALGTKWSAISLQLPQVVLCMGSSFGNSRVEGVLEFCRLLLAQRYCDVLIVVEFSRLCTMLELPSRSCGVS